jgi:hypothetical protein
VKVHGSLSSNDGDVVLGWALDGHGILLRSEWDAAKYLDSGRLQVILPDYTLPSADLYAYYPSRQQQPARARAFIDFLVERIPAATAPRPGEFRDYEEPEQRRAGGGERPDHPRGEQEPGDAVKRPKRSCGSCSAARTTPAPRCPAGRRTECGTA